MDIPTCAALFVVGIIVGLAAGGGMTWLFWGRHKTTALTRLQNEFDKLQIKHELEGEQLLWLERAEAQMREAFQALAGQSLKANSDQFLDRSKSEISHLVDPLGQKLQTLDSYIRELEQKREGAYMGLSEHLNQLGKAQQTLQQTTSVLKRALKDPTSRGHWGELQLKRIVELAGMVEHVDFEVQVTMNTVRPDLVIQLPNDGLVVVDAKVPMNAYLEAVEADDSTTYRAQLKRHARAMRSRVRELAKREYWDQFEHSPDFVVMFVPYESCLSAAFEQDSGLLDYALEARVLIASPITLLAVLKAASYGWQQVQIADNAQHIAAEGKLLHQQISGIANYVLDLGKNLSTANDAFNQMIHSLEDCLIPTARRLEELGADNSVVPTMNPIKGMTSSSASQRLSGLRY